MTATLAGKAFFPISGFPKIVILASVLQSSKAKGSIVATLAGMVTSVREVHSQKAYHSIFTIPSGMVTLAGRTALVRPARANSRVLLFGAITSPFSMWKHLFPGAISTLVRPVQPEKANLFS